MNEKDLFDAMDGIDGGLIDAAHASGVLPGGAKRKSVIRTAAAALVCAVIAVGVFAAVKLANTSAVYQPSAGASDGENIKFAKGGIVTESLDMALNGEYRLLSRDNAAALLPGISFDEAIGVFSYDDGTLLRVEARKYDGNMTVGEVIITRRGLPLADTVIDGEPVISVIGGTQVSGTYFITDGNSRGDRTALFCAEFSTENLSYYAYLSGNARQADTVAEELSGTVRTLIGNGEPDLSVFSPD